MIRTRDFILFILALLFLLIGISYTVSQKEKAGSSTFVAFQSDTVSYSNGAEAEIVELDRSSILARLREKIKLSESVLEAEVSVVEKTEEDEPDPELTEGVAVVIERCGIPDTDLSLARTWPLTDVYIEASEGARVVLQREEFKVPSKTASGTPTTTVSVSETVLLQMPLQPNRRQEVSCVPSEIIGVTLQGSLFFNSDAILYHGRGSEELLGYARDGFPIYGAYSGAVDECGGYQHPLGYRYSISSDRTFTLGCYGAQPMPFIQ